MVFRDRLNLALHCLAGKRIHRIRNGILEGQGRCFRVGHESCIRGEALCPEVLDHQQRIIAGGVRPFVRQVPTCGSFVRQAVPQIYPGQSQVTAMVGYHNDPGIVIHTLFPQLVKPAAKLDKRGHVGLIMDPHVLIRLGQVQFLSVFGTADAMLRFIGGVVNTVGWRIIRLL